MLPAASEAIGGTMDGGAGVWTGQTLGLQVLKQFLTLGWIVGHGLCEHKSVVEQSFLDELKKLWGREQKFKNSTKLDI